MKNKKIIFIVVIVITVVWAAFIFSNSLKNGNESSFQSGRVIDFVVGVMSKFGIEIKNLSALSHFIRKAAHFTEFAVLGALSCFVFSMSRIKKPLQLLFPLIIGFCIACADETIQRFSPDRGPSFVDVIIDFSGVLFAVLVFFGVGCLVGKNNKRDKINAEK